MSTMTTAPYPPFISQVEVLITVKTYPNLSGKYEGLVCTAGVLANGRWIRIYSVPFRTLPEFRQFKKYARVRADLKPPSRDRRPKSYSLASTLEVIGRIDTAHGWAARKAAVLRNVHESLDGMLARRADLSLGTLKPMTIERLIIEREADPEWDAATVARARATRLFLFDEAGATVPGDGSARPAPLRKLSYRYKYEFTTRDGKRRSMTIHDWEIGAIFWQQYWKTGDEDYANAQVRKKYEEEFLSTKDLYLFLGTMNGLHHKAPNPYTIIGVFYPPTEAASSAAQLSLFE